MSQRTATTKETKEYVDVGIVNHMDIANQINNDWKRDTILAFSNKQKGHSFSIRFKNKDKLAIQKKYFKESHNRLNRRLVNFLFAYLIFKVIDGMDISITKVLICPDHRPTREVHRYLQKISHLLGKSDFTQKIDISFINRRKFEVPKRTPAHLLAKKILQGRKKQHIYADLKEAIELIEKIDLKKN